MKPAPGARSSREAMLLAIASTLNATLEIEEALKRVLELAAEALDADAVSVWVRERDRRGQQLRVSFAQRGGEVRSETVAAKLGLSGHVLATGEAVQVDDVSRDPRFAGTLDALFGTRTSSLLAVPLRRGSRVIGLMEALRQEPRPFEREDLEFLWAVADEMAVALENARLVQQLRHEVRERELLLQVARTVGGSLDLAEVLDHLFGALAEVLPYDAGGVYLVDEATGGLTVVEHRGYPEGTAALLEDKPGRGITGWVAKHRRGVVVGDVRRDRRYVEARPSTRSEIAAPIISGGNVIGVINLESDAGDAFTDEDLYLLEMIALQVASAINNARLHRSELDRLRLERELELAREIQEGLLPRATLELGDVEAWGVIVPSQAVGGDYYDYFQECPRHLALAMADVSRQGLSASLLMAAVRSGVRLEMDGCSDPARAAGRLNRLLYESTAPNQFVSAVLALLDRRTGRLRFCNAGHHPPLRVGADGGQRLIGGGLILGAFPHSRYTSRQVQLDRGDLLVYYTDGLVEAANARDEEFGITRLAAIAREHRRDPLHEVAAAIREAVRRHQHQRRDDVALMLVRWLGEDGAAASRRGPRRTAGPGG